jgi:transcriptional regulator with XRE-family HTH domain
LTIGQRIREIRKHYGLNQTDFGERIGLKQTAIGLYENDQRGVADRTILLICEKYSVREEWLRDGTEPMFIESDSTIVSQLSSEYGLDAFEKVLIEGFLKMKPEERAVIKTYVRNLIDTLTTDETAYKEFRAEYDREHALPFAGPWG